MLHSVLCKADESTKLESQRLFGTRLQLSRRPTHSLCLQTCVNNAVTHRGTNPLPRNPLVSALGVECLTVCRQIYHKAKLWLYSANTFSLNSPRMFWTFKEKIGHSTNIYESVLRSMHLYMRINCAADEQEWNAIIKFLAQRMLGLQELFLNISQSSKRRAWGPAPVNPARADAGFLEALPDLKRLPLKTMDLTFSDCRHRSSRFGSTRLEYQWSDEEKTEWADRMKRVVMSLN